MCLNHLNAEYYALAAQVSPKEYYIDGQRNVSKCNGITFINDAETNIDANACYIVWEVYYDFIDRLSAMDFRQEKVGKYIFFIPNSIW